MADETDWVADVKRWYFSQEKAATSPVKPIADMPGLGLDALHPALKSRSRTDVPVNYGKYD